MSTNYMCLLSPAKSLAVVPCIGKLAGTIPYFNDQTSIVEILQKKSVADLKTLMKVSECIAQRTQEELHNWVKVPTGSIHTSDSFHQAGTFIRGKYMILVILVNKIFILRQLTKTN